MRLLMLMLICTALLTPGDTRAAPCGQNQTGDTWGHADPETGAWRVCEDVAPLPLVPALWLPVVLKGEAPPPPVWQLWAPVVLGGAG